MNENFQEGLMLMAVGMLTVFVILFLIVALGNLLIRLVNHFAPADEKQISKKTTKEPPIRDIPAAQLAAIVATVQTVTHGQGQVREIQKA
ncbi:OadG family protein [Persicobacter psychrovividus]|uniref:Oxaloacetate decarboxylase gamma chain n=1 Tax=Persicobacter psychrovividus TaxID=387638 RepID=A0ABN6LA48_9BACT|nr:hypothetical protein PEPS_21660 [Persicobacter psychrovividus]